MLNYTAEELYTAREERLSGEQHAVCEKHSHIPSEAGQKHLWINCKPCLFFPVNLPFCEINKKNLSHLWRYRRTRCVTVEFVCNLFEPRWPVFIYTGCDPLPCPNVARVKLFKQPDESTAGKSQRGKQSGKRETLHHYTHLFHSHGDLSHE